jgi:hypothetical protein
MKRTLLVTTAALAVLAGANAALSQGTKDSSAPAQSGATSQSPSTGATAPMTNDSQTKQRNTQERGSQDQPTQRQSGSQDKSQKQSESPSDRQQNRASQSEKSGDQKRNQQTQTEKSGGQRDGQGRADSRDQQNGKGTQSTQQGASPDSKTGTTTGQRGTSQGTQGTTTSQSSTGGSASANVTLTAEQKTTIRQAVLTGSAPRVTSVDFDVRIGTVVPRSVRLEVVPAKVVEIHPAWRGYRYFVYKEEIVIIEPDTLRIVAVVQV